MSTPRASVVVPVYNTAAWLPEALTSIDCQACRADLEVVIVDDGATDDSPRIAREYADRAAGVRYVRQENAGLGAARNHGLRLATGRYLAFLDSDDRYAEGGLDELLRLADTHDALVVVGDMQGIPPRPNPAWRRELVTGERVISALDEAPDLVGNPSACNKVFRRDMVTASGARFTEGTAFEDVLFTLPMLLRADRIALTPRLAYLYRTRGDGTSIMDTRSRPDRIFQHLAIIERLAGELGSVSVGTRRAVQRWIAYMQLHYAWRAANALDDEQFVEFARRMSALFKDIPVDVSSEFVTDFGAGVRAVAIYEQDTATARKPRFSGPLYVRGGQVYAGHPRFDRYRELLRLPVLTGGVTGLGAGTPPVVRGILRAPGFVAVDGEVRADILLEIGDGLVRRPVTIRGTAGNTLRWACAIPVASLGASAHRVRLVVRDDGREYDIPLGGDSHSTRATPLGDGRTGWIMISKSVPRLVIAGSALAVTAQAPVWFAGAAYRRTRRLADRAKGRLRRLTKRSLKR